MSEEIQQKAIANVKPSDELSAEELAEANGGTKVVDKSSPNLFKACATGEHIKSATIVD